MEARFEEKEEWMEDNLYEAGREKVKIGLQDASADANAEVGPDYSRAVDQWIQLGGLPST